MWHLSVHGLASFLQHHPRACVLDVRFAHERAGGHLPGDHHVPWYTHDFEPNPVFVEQARQSLDPALPVLVICRNGQSSWQAAALLELSGFARVYNILGGYADLGNGASGHGPGTVLASLCHDVAHEGPASR